MVYFRNPFRRQHFRERSGASGFAQTRRIAPMSDTPDLPPEDIPPPATPSPGPDTPEPVAPIPGPDIPAPSTPPTGPSPTRY